jgi:hypothetical protein
MRREPGGAMTGDPPLTAQQQLVLQTIYDRFRGDGNWPTCIAVDRPLRRERRIDTGAVLQGIPERLLLRSRPGNYRPLSDDQLRLTIRGIAACNGSGDDIEHFVRLLRWLARLEVEFEPVAAETMPRATSRQIDENLGLRGDASALRRLYAMLHLDHWGLSGTSASGDEWSVTVAPDIWRFRDVRSAEDCAVAREKWMDEGRPQPAAEQVQDTDEPYDAFILPADATPLTAAEAHPDGREYIGSQTLSQKGAEVASSNAIFISHAHADRALADLLRNTLLLGGVPEEQIFYSSSRATGIPSGENVRTYLQRTLRKSGLVIELVSETFLTRPMCLMELGGAWTLGTATYPVVVPPLSRDLAVKAIGNIQMGFLGTDADLDDLFDELHDRLAKDVSIQTKTTPWNRAIREFKLQLASKLTPIPESADATSARPIRPTTPNSGPDEEISISNTSVGTTSQGRQLFGEVTNNDSIQHSAILTATFYGSGGASSARITR